MYEAVCLEHDEMSPPMPRGAPPSTASDVRLRGEWISQTANEAPASKQRSPDPQRSSDSALDQLAIITCHFNPVGYCLPRRNYWQWRHSLGALQRLLTTVEVSYDGHFMVPDALKIHARTEHLLWQKEAMINAAVRQLPSHIRYVAWIDHDLIFESTAWAEQAIERLERDHAVVQLFDSVRYTHSDGRHHYDAPGAVWGHLNAASKPGQPGGAWAARRDYFEKIDGLPPSYILGGGDRITCETWLGLQTFYWDLHPPALKSESCAWASRARRLLGDLRVGCIPGRPVHLYHGRLCRRFYRKRTEILQEHRYDPKLDIRFSGNGLVEWCSHKPQLHRAAATYFYSRREDET